MNPTSWSKNKYNIDAETPEIGSIWFWADEHCYIQILDVKWNGESWFVRFFKRKQPSCVSWIGLDYFWYNVREY